MSEVSQKQLEANRQNAKLGGVKTEEGKAITRYNAIKHGLLSKEVLIDGEDEQALASLGKKLRQELQPTTEIEMVLVDRIIANTWRLKRIMGIERKTMVSEYKHKFHSEYRFKDEWETEDDIDEQATSEMISNEVMEKLIRYETSIERSIYKALHELQRIQSARSGKEVSAPVAVDVDINKD